MGSVMAGSALTIDVDDQPITPMTVRSGTLQGQEHSCGVCRGVVQACLSHASLLQLAPSRRDSRSSA